jgi:hypothetical protein
MIHYQIIKIPQYQIDINIDIDDINRGKDHICMYSKPEVTVSSIIVTVSVVLVTD